MTYNPPNLARVNAGPGKTSRITPNGKPATFPHTCPPHAQVLAIQHMQCRCGTEYSFPLERILYRYELTTNAQHLSLDGIPYYGIHYEVKHLDTVLVDHCESCFKQYYPENQFELFPELIIPPPPPPRRKRVEEGSAGIPTKSEKPEMVMTLADF